MPAIDASQAPRPPRPAVREADRKVECDGGLATWVPSSALRLLRWLLATRSMPISGQSWLLRMARRATSSIHHCGWWIPRRCGNRAAAIAAALPCMRWPMEKLTVCTCSLMDRPPSTSLLRISRLSACSSWQALGHNPTIFAHGITPCRLSLSDTLIS